MSVKYIPVQWNRNKYAYDAVMLAAVGLFLWVYLRLTPGWVDHARPVDGAIHNARAFGLCAFLMLSVILAIGPLARLDRRFLPLLYNRRHFGVMTVFVALTHAGYILGWYYAFSPHGPLCGAADVEHQLRAGRGLSVRDVWGVRADLSRDPRRNEP